MNASIDRPWQRIQWRKPPEVHRNRLSSAFIRTFAAVKNVFVAEEAIPADPVRAAIEQYGVPHIDGTPLQKAQLLLAAGGEVEHALLVQYLYATWSVSGSPAADTIVDIAIQEMLHFITVQNLLLFVGSNPRMNRQDQDPAPELDPFAFTLRPFSKMVLEDFLLAEMPQAAKMTAGQRKVMQPIIDQRKQGGSIVHPVGVIYAWLFWLFQPDDSPTAPWPEVAGLGFEPGHISVFPGQGAATTFEADPVAETAWDRGHGRDGVFENIGSRDQALKAIYEIAAQGEGPVADAAGLPTHFARFFDLYQNTDFSNLPSSNWPTDPYVSDTQANDPAREANRITNPVAAALSGVLDLRYRIALACIRAALSHDRSNGQDLATRTKYIKWLFGEMKGNVRALVFGLARQPRKAGAGAGQPVAGPSFNLDGFQLPDTPAELDKALFSLHQDAAGAITAALAQPVDISLKATLGQMLQNDKLRYPNLIA